VRRKVQYWKGLRCSDSRAQRLIGALYTEAIRGNKVLDGAVALADKALAAAAEAGAAGQLPQPFGSQPPPPSADRRPGGGQMAEAAAAAASGSGAAGGGDRLNMARRAQLVGAAVDTLARW
jgi:hypothetical protein